MSKGTLERTPLPWEPVRKVRRKVVETTFAFPTKLAIAECKARASKAAGRVSANDFAPAFHKPKSNSSGAGGALHLRVYSVIRAEYNPCAKP